MKLKDDFGGKLLTSLCISTVNTLPRYCLPDVAEVIFELMLLDRPQVRRRLLAP